jgi:hypothetical protein
MPRASTSTVAPSVVFDALFTTAALSPFDEDVVLAGAVACEEEVDLLELPHAASVSDAASAGRRNFIAERIRELLCLSSEKRRRRFAKTMPVFKDSALPSSFQLRLSVNDDVGDLRQLPA